MCMDHGPFLLVRGDEQLALEDIGSIVVSGGELKLVDVFGKTRTVAGKISEIDLLNQRIVLG